ALSTLGGFVDAPAIRSYLSLESSDPIPPYGELVNSPSQAFDFCNKRLAPVISTFTSLRPPPYTTTDLTGLSEEDWRILAGGVQRASFHASQTIILFGERPTLKLQAAVIDLDNALANCSDLFSQWSVERSGAGVMAYQVALLESLADAAHGSISILRELA